MRRWDETFPRGSTTTASALSVALHAALIGAAVVATAAPDIQRRDIPEVSIARFLAPPDRAGGQTAQRELLKFVALAEPANTVPGTRPHLAEERRPERQRASGIFQQTVEARPQIVGSDSVFTALDVDSAASRYAWSAAPAYPGAMLELKREGFVKAQWVVDEAGYADTVSLKIVDSTSQEFAKAVRDALPFMRFSPAKMGATAVRQLVEQEFTFRISSVMIAPGATKKPIP
jgi:hypothetical protein